MVLQTFHSVYFYITALSDIMQFVYFKHLIQWFLVHAQGCTTTAINSRTFSSSPRRDSIPLSRYSSTTPHPTPRQPLIDFMSLWSCLLDGSDKRNPTVCGILWLASSTGRVFKVHPRCSMNQYLILFPNWVIPHCTERPQCLYPFISSETFGLFPIWGYCE